MDTSGVGSSGRATTGWRGVVDRWGPQRAIPVIGFGGFTLLLLVVCVVLTVARDRPPVTLLLFVLAFALMTLGSLRAPRYQPTLALARRRDLRRRLRHHDVRDLDGPDLASYQLLAHGSVRTMPWFALATVPMAISFHLQAEERLVILLEFEATALRVATVVVILAGFVQVAQVVWRRHWRRRTSQALAGLAPAPPAR